MEDGRLYDNFLLTKQIMCGMIQKEQMFGNEIKILPDQPPRRSGNIGQKPKKLQAHIGAFQYVHVMKAANTTACYIIQRSFTNVKGVIVLSRKMLISGFDRVCSEHNYKKFILATTGENYDSVCYKMNPNTLYFYNNGDINNGLFIRNISIIEYFREAVRGNGDTFVMTTLLNKKFTILAK